MVFHLYLGCMMCIRGTREKDFLLGLLCISSPGNIEVRFLWFDTLSQAHKELRHFTNQNQ